MPILDLGVINKQPHSFSTTTIVNDAYPPRSSPSPMTTTSHDPERPDTPTTSTPHQERHSSAMSPPTAHTYKHHSLGDYMDEIRERGTTDSYSTEPVSLYSFMLTSEFLIEVNLGRTGTQKPKGTVSTHGQEDVHKAVDTDRAAPSSFTSIEKKVFQIHRRCRKYQ